MIEIYLVHPNEELYFLYFFRFHYIIIDLIFHLQTPFEIMLIIWFWDLYYFEYLLLVFYWPCSPTEQKYSKNIFQLGESIEQIFCWQNSFWHFHQHHYYHHIHCLEVFYEFSLLMVIVRQWYYRNLRHIDIVDVVSLENLFFCFLPDFYLIYDLMLSFLDFCF